MRKWAGILLIILGMALPASSQDTPKLMTFLSYTATTSIFIDTGLTYEALWNHNCYEANILWRPLMKHPPLVMTLDLAIGAGITILAHKLYPRNKTLAWAVVIGANIVQGYFLYYHWTLRRDPRW